MGGCRLLGAPRISPTQPAKKKVPPTPAAPWHHQAGKEFSTTQNLGLMQAAGSWGRQGPLWLEKFLGEPNTRPPPPALHMKQAKHSLCSLGAMETPANGEQTTQWKRKASITIVKGSEDIVTDRGPSKWSLQESPMVRLLKLISLQGTDKGIGYAGFRLESFPNSLA